MIRPESLAGSPPKRRVGFVRVLPARLAGRVTASGRPRAFGRRNRSGPPVVQHRRDRCPYRKLESRADSPSNPYRAFLRSSGGPASAGQAAAALHSSGDSTLDGLGVGPPAGRRCRRPSRGSCHRTGAGGNGAWVEGAWRCWRCNASTAAIRSPSGKHRNQKGRLSYRRGSLRRVDLLDPDRGALVRSRVSSSAVSWHSGSNYLTARRA